MLSKTDTHEEAGYKMLYAAVVMGYYKERNGKIYRNINVNMENTNLGKLQ